MHKQQGMTFIGVLLMFVVVVMAATIIMRVIPVYIQYYSIIESIKGLNSIPASSLTGDSYEDVSFLKSSLYKRLDINGVENVKENQINIVPNGDNQFNVNLKYQVIKPLVYNVSLLFKFDHTEMVRTGSEN